MKWLNAKKHFPVTPGVYGVDAKSHTGLRMTIFAYFEKGKWVSSFNILYWKLPEV
jgi:hypothetical protein